MLATLSALLLLLIIPGPTNTLLFRAGVLYGFSVSQRLAFIESLAYLIQVSLWGFTLLYLSAYSPLTVKIVQFSAACYLLYISYKLWQRENSITNTAKDRFSGPYFFLLTLMNPKGLLTVSFIAPIHTFTELESYVEFMAALLLVTISVGSAWIFFGARFKGFHQTRFTTLKINRVTSVTLFCFASTLIGRLAGSVLN
ncbi:MULTISPECIES: LysE family translocator [unclassified Pseudomonas]|uniref:LysE family translocator n=1 Tax=unclassified Pseudomonas TaxID=196821 RepID=UPI000F57E413|nr:MULTISPECIES: LysE family transporter [unclassified Pseudomonas]AZF23248.1 CmaU [Pseudomonas sp. R3-52-08]AZF28506.1 CmaU [Pseudomonas sp. R2-60-08W]AZF33824.1 CmaU [Pseudomonas sp. R4-35-07]